TRSSHAEERVDISFLELLSLKCCASAVTKCSCSFPKRKWIASRSPPARNSDLKSCRRSDFLRFIRQEFSDSSADSPKVFPVADQFIRNLNRRSFSAWVDSLRLRRFWPAGCVEFPRSFTNRMRSRGKRIGSRQEWCARFCSASKNAPRFFPKCAPN